MRFFILIRISKPIFEFSSSPTEYRSIHSPLLKGGFLVKRENNLERRMVEYYLYLPKQRSIRR